MFQAVIESIKNYGTFSVQELLFFESKLQHLIIPRKTFILSEYQICQSFYFLLCGSAIHTYHGPEGIDTVLNFYTPDTWFTDYNSFTAQKPSSSSIMAFEPCELAILSIDSLHELIRHSAVFFKAGKLMQSMQHTDLNTLSLSPEEKYQNLLQTRPEIIRTFPLKSVASYLRMAPETLSRIRKRIS